MVFKIAFRKMLSNKWMFICTLLASMMMVALLSSIPIYTDGIMQRMLTKDLENSQMESKKFPGSYFIKYNTYNGNGSIDEVQQVDNEVSKVIEDSMPLPIITKASLMRTDSYKILSETSDQNIITSLCSLSDMNNHIEILHGKMFSNKKTADGAYEIIVSEEGAKVLNLTLGNTYKITNKFLFSSKNEKMDKIKVVGIFTYKTLDDLYWFKDIKEYKNDVFMDESLLVESMKIKPDMSIQEKEWFYAYDYHKINVKNLWDLKDAFESHEKWFKNNSSLEYQRPMDEILNKYEERAKELNLTLIVLQIPIIVVLVYYLFMISKLKIDFEGNEIAVIKSRGGSSSLVFNIYLIESTVVGVIALILGPLLGFYLCKILGASNGFLQFIERSALPLTLGKKAYLYALIAVIVIYICTLIPAFIASKSSIVMYKRKNSKKSGKSFLHKYFIDVILLGIAFYGLYGYKRQQMFLQVSGVKGTELTIDPLLYIISVLFILGGGLLILRVFPYFIKFIFSIGKKAWNSVFYASLTQIANSSKQNSFAMIFIILTLSIGIFSANSARTINKNMEDKVRYKIGADIVIKGHWTDNQSKSSNTSGPSIQINKNEKGTSEIFYNEPPFDPYTKLNGVESATKVFRKDNSNVNVNSESIDNAQLMGIIPNEFGKTAWFRNDLLPHHWYEYLNLMTDAPNAMLVSKAFKEKNGVKEGDQICVNWGQGRCVYGVVYAFVDYWPALNPNAKVEDRINPYFVVANLNYLQAKNIVEPYEVWIKKKDEAKTSELYKDITDKKIEIDSIQSSTDEIVKLKNEPMLQGTNGEMTLGFIVTILVCFSGFLIYWILSIRKRVLQFGIFRAIGLTKMEITGMLVCEQFFITGTSIFSGIALGNLASKLFIPLFQMVYGAEEQVPPFKIVSAAGDYIRLYVILGLMLIVCLYVIWKLISKLNISQALKLGED